MSGFLSVYGWFVILSAFCMPSIRRTKTSSGSTAVQVVEYRKRKMVLLKHFGSARTKAELQALIQDAAEWIAKQTGQASLFAPAKDRVLHLGVTRFLGVRYQLGYALLREVLCRLGFAALDNDLLLDLAVMRVFEPSSKRRAVELLHRYFGIRYAERTLYRALPKLIAHKEATEKIAVSFAKQHLNDQLSFVLYDVTTLYFESFESDTLRKTGFSKDNKANQPQIVVGLLVNPDGFPLGYEIFKGNTFEGHTMLPVINAFRTAHAVEWCTIVADAAMLSLANLQELKKQNLSYIVGARVANLSPAVIASVSSSLNQEDGKTVRISMEHGDLVCAFSALRFRKDKMEMEKQIKKAEALIASDGGRRAKFVSTVGSSFTLNTALVDKTKKLLGIKGYYTNIPLGSANDRVIIVHYGNLWRIEQSFRMAKSDLVARPIFHHKENAVKAHMLICFVALAAGKYLELMTGVSLRRIIDLLKQAPDARMLNTRTHEEILLRAEMPEEMKAMLEKLSLSY